MIKKKGEGVITTKKKKKKMKKRKNEKNHIIKYIIKSKPTTY